MSVPVFPLSRDVAAVPEACVRLRLRQPVTPVRTMTGDPAWLVTGYEEARQVLEDERFSLKDTSAPGVPRQYALTIPPEVVNNMGSINSAGLRDAVMKSLRPTTELKDWLLERAHALIDDMVAEGPPAELRDAFSEPYSAALHCKIIGLPFTSWRRLMAGIDLAFVTSPEPFEGAAVNWYKDHAYMLSHLKAAPDSGLLARFAELRESPWEVADDDLLATVAVALFGAGAVSTSAFLLHAVIALLRQPELAERLRSRPEDIPRAVEELLRPNLSIGDALPRMATEDVTLAQTEIKKGELVLVLVEGANYDPAVFPDPETIDIDRPDNPHLSFGAGRHFCPASALGRAYANVAISALVERLPRLRLALPLEQIAWRPEFIKRLPERLPVLW